MENNRAVYDTTCTCNKNTEGCFCLSDSKEMNRNQADHERILIMEQLNCPCNDPVIAERLNYEILVFLSKKFRSKRWLKMIFGKKLECAMNGINIRTRVSLICNHYRPPNE